MKVYIVMEHSDGIGGTANDMADIILGVFFDQRRAEDFVRGIISYICAYDGQRLFFEDGKAQDEHHAIHFQVIEQDAI